MNVEIVKALTYNGITDDVFQCSGFGACGFHCQPFGKVDSVTVSVWAKSSVSEYYTFILFGEQFTKQISTEWERLFFKVESPVYINEETHIKINKINTAILQLYKMMVEVNADVPSDWKAAPEEIEEKVENNSDFVNKAVVWYEFTEYGLRTQQKNKITGEKISPWSTLVDNSGFHIDHDNVVGGHVGSFHNETLEVRSQSIGNLKVISSEPSLTGGWVWIDK